MSVISHIRISQICDVRQLSNHEAEGGPAIFPFFCPNSVEKKIYHVQHAGDLQPEWLEGAETVGITAGTSTPDWIIGEVERRLEDFGK